MEQVRWGILSVSGHYALRVHQPLSRLPGAQIAAIASRGAGRAAQAAASLGIPKAYGSYAELLADPAIDAVYIPLPNNLHAEWAIAALEAGKHVLCEKPIGLDAGQARAIAAKAEEKGLVAMEAFMYRFHPQWVRAREIVASGELGRIRAIQGWFSYSNADPQNIRNIVETGGGALYDIGCYAVSSARFLAAAAAQAFPMKGDAGGGPSAEGRSRHAEPMRVLSLVERDPVFGTDVMDSCILDFGPAGPRSTFHVSTKAFPVQRVEAMGERGSLAVDLPFNAYPDVPLALEVSNGLGTRRIKAGPADQYGLMFSAFCKAVREGTGAPTPMDDAIANMAVLDALFRSEKSGTWAEV